MRLATALLFLAMTVTGASAADNAERAAIGFSPDGRYFAFEQYGVQDGSGFPYSEIFVVDLDANQWVKGSPFRERIEDEASSVSSVRAKAAKSAAALIGQLKTAEPGDALAAQLPTQAVADRHRIGFDSFYQSQTNQKGGQYTLSLELLPFAAPESCNAEDGKQMGFRLTLKDNESGAEKEVHKDAAIPSSRYCPRDYDISDVISYRPASGPSRQVALIGVYTPGFEGVNRRFIAVPFALP
jgi:predicted secreted protein